MLASRRNSPACLPANTTPGIRSSYCFAMLALCTIGFSLSAHAANMTYDDLPSITAEHISTHTDSETILSRARVQFAPGGMRILQQGTDGMSEYIQNFKTNQVWLIDRRRAIVHELSLVEVEENTPTVDEDDEITGEPQPGLLTAEPCIDLEPLKIGLSTWRGQTVSVWHCLKPSQQVFTKQFFSLSRRIVIREERVDGSINELRGIESANFSENHFFPADKLRKTGLRDLMLGTPEISGYSEQSDTN